MGVPPPGIVVPRTPHLALSWCQFDSASMLIWLCLVALALPWCQPGFGPALVLIWLWLCLGANLALALPWCLFGFGSALMLIWFLLCLRGSLALLWCLFGVGSTLVLLWLRLGANLALLLRINGLFNGTIFQMNYFYSLNSAAFGEAWFPWKINITSFCATHKLNFDEFSQRHQMAILSYCHTVNKQINNNDKKYNLFIY
jgi:hypothetical protein